MHVIKIPLFWRAHPIRLEWADEEVYSSDDNFRKQCREMIMMRSEKIDNLYLNNLNGPCDNFIGAELKRWIWLDWTGMIFISPPSLFHDLHQIRLRSISNAAISLLVGDKKFPTNNLIRIIIDSEGGRRGGFNTHSTHQDTNTHSALL